MKEPVDHIARPRLPWRSSDADITECGYDASKVKTVSRAEFSDRLKNLGQQRTAMLMCMTCSDTASRWSDWESDPRQALDREISWERGERYRARTDRGYRLHDELRAIAALIEAHREEFDAHINSTEQRRAWLLLKDARATKTESRS